jgi:hypothetical protein
MPNFLRYTLSVKKVVYRLVTVLLYLNLIYCSSFYPLSTMTSTTRSSSSCSGMTSNCNPTPEPLPKNMPSFYQRKLPETWYVSCFCFKMYIYLLCGKTRSIYSYICTSLLINSLEQRCFCFSRGKENFQIFTRKGWSEIFLQPHRATSYSNRTSLLWCLYS